MRKNWREYISTVCRGEGRSLCSDNSDVSLKIPEGLNSVFSLRVHTDHARFRELVPHEECIIGPMVEVEKTDLKEDEVTEIGYTVKIPHCIGDKRYWSRIKVRCGDMTRPISFGEIPSQESATGYTYYTIDKHFITIRTRHFCLFICTICNQEVRLCQTNGVLFLVGSLTTLEEEIRSEVVIEPFLCSRLYDITDYEEVSLLEKCLPDIEVSYE